MKEGYKQTEVGVIPEDWEVIALGEIGHFKNGINKESESFGHGYPFVNLLDIFGRNSLKDKNNLGLINTTDIERKTYNLYQGDTIFVRSSVKPSGVGLTSVIEKDLANTVYSGFLIRYRDNGYIDLKFKKHCFYERGFRSRLIAASSVSANTNINQDSLKSLLLILPSKPEQKAIAKALGDMDALIQSLEQLIAKKRQIKQGAMQKLLHPYDDKGELKKGWSIKKLGETVNIDPENLPSSTPPDYEFKYISLENGEC